MRSDNDCYSVDGLKPHCDISVVRRTVWAGDSELLEIQRPASGMPLLYLGDTVTTAMMECDTSILALPVRPYGVSGYGYNRALDPGTLFGTVAYLHGLGIDRPLSMTRVGFEYRDDTGAGDPHKRWAPFTIIPHWDARGAARSGTFANGAVRHVLDVPADDYHGEAVVPWTMDELATARFQQEIILQWHGTLLSGKRDGTGTYYRRNRHYDPSTARFTQEDPIGFAGGYNLYGYAGGDPINYHDPFGLCPKAMRGDADACFAWNQRQVDLALHIVRTERARGNPHALDVPAGSVLGGNDDQIRADCSRLGQVTNTGCVGSTGNDIYVNADRDPAAIAWTIIHEYQHVVGRGSAAGSENCAVRRAGYFFRGLSPETRNAAASSQWPASGTLAGTARTCGF